jgi:hypothetical protein
MSNLKSEPLLPNPFDLHAHIKGYLFTILPHERIDFFVECMKGYCQHCGHRRREISGNCFLRCHCQNDD